MSLDGLSWGLFAVKCLLYISALLAAGLSAHVALGVAPRESKTLRLAAGASVVALLCGGTRFALTGVALGGPASAFDNLYFNLVWQTQGAALVALAVGASVLLAAAALNLRVLLLVGTVPIAASFALTGHTQAVPAPLLTPLAVAVHVLFAGWWFAAPATLWPRSALANDVLTARLERFSAVAIYIVPALFALGVALALRLSGGVSLLLTTAYGWLLLAKLSAAGIAGLAGAYNKFSITGLIAAGTPTARGRLKAALRVEAAGFALALVALAAATTLTGPEIPAP